MLNVNMLKRTSKRSYDRRKNHKSSQSFWKKKTDI